MQSGRERRLLGLAQDVADGAPFRWWCRRVQESCAGYGVPMHARGEHCWERRAEIEKVPYSFDPDTFRATHWFYGCLRCSRTHLCQPPDYLTCPRLASTTDFGTFVCPFSGTQLSDLHRALHNSSYDQQGALLAAMEDRLTNRELRSETRTSMPMGKQVAYEHVQHGNIQFASADREREYRMAGQAKRRMQAQRAIRQFNKLTAKNTFRADAIAQAAAAAAAAQKEPTPPSSPTPEASEPPPPAQAVDPVAEKELEAFVQREARARELAHTLNHEQQLRHRQREHLMNQLAPTLPDPNPDPDATDVASHYPILIGDLQGGGGGGAAGEEDDAENRAMYQYRSEWREARLTGHDVMDFNWDMPVLLIPDIEMREDLDYLRHVLDPIVDYFAQEDAGPDPFPWHLFASTAPPPPDVSTSSSSSESSSSATSSPVVPKPRVLRRPPVSATKRPVKRKRDASLGSAASKEPCWTVLGFQTTTSSVLAHQRVVCDYMERFVAHFSTLHPLPTTPIDADSLAMEWAVFCDRLLWVYHQVTGMREGTLWPREPKGGLPRILFAILTLILTQPGFARDPVSAAKIPVWLPSLWLVQLQRAGHLDPQRVPSFILPAQQRGSNLAHYRDRLMPILKCTAFSPHTLAAFLRPRR